MIYDISHGMNLVGVVLAPRQLGNVGESPHILGTEEMAHTYFQPVTDWIYRDKKLADNRELCAMTIMDF